MRRATDEDWDDILEADRACFPHDAPPPRDGAWWVVELDGTLAAYAAVRAAETSPGAAYLCRVGVLPAFRGRGLQRVLVRARERWARARGFTHTVTDTYYNPASANTLIRCGYRMFEPARPWALDGACYLMRKL